MPRPIRPWFRFYTEAFNDRKMLRLTPTQRWLWVAVLGAARDSCEPGRLLVAVDAPMTERELARYADVRDREVRPALDLMTQLGMVVEVDGVIEVVNFSSRQYESDNVTARTQAHRERSKEQGRNVPTSFPGTGFREDRNGPETETETEQKKSVGARKRGTRIQADWIPDAEVREAMSTEYPQIDLKTEHAKFLDYWMSQPGQKGTKLDWNATWRNWIRNARPALRVVPVAPSREAQVRYEESQQVAPSPEALPW